MGAEAEAGEGALLMRESFSDGTCIEERGEMPEEKAVRTKLEAVGSEPKPACESRA